MDISLLKVLVLAGSLLFSGRPDKVNHDLYLSAKVSLGLGTSTEISLDLSYDPVLIYENRDLPNNLCGLSVISSIYIAPDWRRETLGCRYTLEHEMAHVWQYRQHGLLYPLWYLVFNREFEPKPGNEAIPWHKRVVNFPLLKVSLSLAVDK